MSIIAVSELFPSLHEVTFAEKDPDTITQEIISLYESSADRTLARADPVRLFIDAIILAVVQQRNVIDHAAKMNLLAYASGTYLEHLGALLGVSRLPASAASCTLRFTLSHSYSVNVIIPHGTRASAGGGVTFATTQELVIPAGSLTGDVQAKCTQPGIHGNGYVAGQVNRLVDVLGYDLKAVNITESSGGAEIESDENFRERIQIAPESFSVAGPVNAYKYFAMSANPGISDVAVVGPPATQPGYVEIYPLMEGGILPGAEVLNEVLAACNADDVRPDTDFLSVKPPVVVNYSVNVDFWIDSRNSSNSMMIKAACESAVQEWILWQKSKLGRDINPSELTRRIINAGAKRCVITQPAFRVLNDWELGECQSVSVNYRGLERG